MDCFMVERGRVSNKSGNQGHYMKAARNIFLNQRYLLPDLCIFLNKIIAVVCSGTSNLVSHWLYAVLVASSSRRQRLQVAAHAAWRTGV